jgi:hypothetical protein
MTIHVSMQNVEVLGFEAPNLHVSMQNVEVLGFEAPNLHVSMQNVEVLGFEAPNLHVSKICIEVLLDQHFPRGLVPKYYGTIHGADEYFAQRLHEQTWSRAKATDHEKALWAASLIIDALNFKGDKHSVYEVLQANSNASAEIIRAADASQVLEFPRDADTEVPEEIRVATYEIAHSLLDGKDPDLELEALGIVSQSIQDTTTSYSREQVPIEHIINGIPSTQAWRLLRSYLREDDAIILSRIS